MAKIAAILPANRAPSLEESALMVSPAARGSDLSAVRRALREE